MNDEPARPFWRLCDMTASDRGRFNRFNFWALGWVLLWLGVTLLIRVGVLVPGPLALSLAVAVSLIGMLVIRAYMVFLRQIDELLRKIQVEALALGFGAGAIFMMGYGLAERAGAPTLDVSDPVVVMMFFWALGQWLGVRRYQ